MKKILLLLMMIGLPGFMVLAQERVKNETKVRKTSTIPEKVHNTVSKHKHYNGYKVKHKKEVEKMRHKRHKKH
ncbi:MAG TPA: hypothetical protein VN721_07805 [Flavipsychrobacter sp.]|nr:hypothetical protein [Flavipsychrobacter sp.]